MEPAPPLAAFAVTAPGLERIVAAELRGLGADGVIEDGGVSWPATIESLARANLWLRAASRVVVRVASFRARSFAELERHAHRVPWQRFVDGQKPVRFRVTSRKSRLYHTGAIAQRLAAAAGIEGDEATDDDRRDDPDAREPLDAQLFIVRGVRDVWMISADSSGALLHRRGYRQAIAKAPLRETLAAAMVLGSGWLPDAPLLDPFCGSGTIAIEAAMIARRIAPGLSRRFAFEEWPGVEAATVRRIAADARANVLPSAPAGIHASDRDAGAIEAALANAERAGVGADIAFDRRPISAIEPPGTTGWILTNPPYGVRITGGRDVRDLYATLGAVLRQRFSGWRVGVMSPDPELDRQIGLSLTSCFETENGGIRVRLLAGGVDGRP